MNNDVTILQAKSSFLASVKLKRSDATVKAYTNALETFLIMLAKQNLDVDTVPVDELREVSISDFVTYINDLSPATESLYLQVIKSFFEFLYAENLSVINISQVRMLIRQRTRRPKAQSSEYPEEDIKRLIDYMQMLSKSPTSDPDFSKSLFLRDMRDRALILTLADTGLRVEELCKLKVGDLDWKNNRATLVGRGKKQSLIRFSTRAMNSVKLYLDLRLELYGITGTSLATLPLFARHDKGAGKKIKPVTSVTIRRIVTDRVTEVLGSESAGVITPHTFLHYFVTTILRTTGNLKLAQVLARHANIQVTQRYAHLSDDELDKGYYEIFEKKDKEP